MGYDPTDSKLKFIEGHGCNARTGANEVTTLTCECSPGKVLEVWGDPDEVVWYISPPSIQEIQRAIDEHYASLEAD